MKRLGCMSMYQQNFVLRWVMSLSAAEDLGKLERFEFALVNFGLDPVQVHECRRIATRVIIPASIVDEALTKCGRFALPPLPFA